MIKRDVYKKGMRDASNTYREKFNRLRQNEAEMRNARESIDLKNQYIQSELIKNAERVDEDLDRIYEILGVERTPGKEGDAVFTENSSQMMTGYINGTLNKYNTCSNLFALSTDFQLADAVADFLTVTVERDMNRKFHKSLSILEQNGLLSQEKFEEHKHSVVVAKQMTGLGVYTTFSLAPMIAVTIKNYLNKNDIIDFVIGSYAYINKEYNILIGQEIFNVLREMDIQVSEDKIKSTFDKYKGENGLSRIPIFSKRNMAIFGENGKDDLAKEIVSRCNLHDSDVNNRALEFIEDFLRVDINSAKEIVENSICAQNSLSDITWLSALNYKYIFSDFIKNAANVRQFAFYDLDNDPYCRIREDRQQRMENIVRDVSARKGLFLTTGKRKDIIDASAKMIQYSLNPEYDIETDIKMIRREKEVLKLYE